VTDAVLAFSFGGPGVNAIGKTGVFGWSGFLPDPNNPRQGTGVFGESLGAVGVCGSTITGTGVLGIGHPVLGAWAGCFRGNVFVDGLLFKLVSFFSIDHPLDPANKTLNHAAVEAPEHKTLYDGVVRLDGRGRAAVRFPRWFAALNDVRRLRYQLTSQGRPAPDLHIAREFRNGAFLIAGGAPRQTVYWQVSGVRRDPVALANPVVVEQPKSRTRPTAADPNPAALRRVAAQVERAASELKREVDARKRMAKPQRSAPRTAPLKMPRPTTGRSRPTPLVKETLSIARRLMRVK
jgi:hypothetical protein